MKVMMRVALTFFALAVVSILLGLGGVADISNQIDNSIGIQNNANGYKVFQTSDARTKRSIERAGINDNPNSMESKKESTALVLSILNKQKKAE